MGSTVGASYKTGSVVATGADLTIRVVDFKPRKIVVTNETSLAEIEWHEGMDDGAAWKTVAAGTRTLEATTGITPEDGTSALPPGFTIGAEADINDTTTEILQWEAWS